MKKCPLKPDEARQIAARLSKDKEHSDILFRQVYLHLTEGNLSIEAELRAALLNYELAVLAMRKKK